MAASTGDTTVTTEHQMVVSLGLMVGFVVVATIVAGSGPKAGHVMVLIMIMLLVAQGLGHISPFAAWASSHPLTGPNPTPATSPSTTSSQ
jgi:hypothetical protein